MPPPARQPGCPPITGFSDWSICCTGRWPTGWLPFLPVRCCHYGCSKRTWRRRLLRLVLCQLTTVGRRGRRLAFRLRIRRPGLSYFPDFLGHDRGPYLPGASNARDLLGRILNTKALAQLGLLSYSLYIWQQLFLYQQP
jgi:hypothetical protein